MTPKTSSKEAAARTAVGVGDDFPELADLAFLLDSKWRIPVLGIRFGVDALASLVPVVGDVATGVISAYVVHKAHRLGAPRQLVLQMAGNVLIDVVVGSVPLVGSLFDLFFKANNINVRLLRQHLAAQGKALPPPLPGQQAIANPD
ncbi:MAG: DUF4112 domain-containing protein [Mesorhizobium sp.]|nr:DUF4112 domain-containing protein [Mesorhizobium sp.]